jgi:hypothetical protein
MSLIFLRFCLIQIHSHPCFGPKILPPVRYVLLDVNEGLPILKPYERTSDVFKTVDLSVFFIFGHCPILDPDLIRIRIHNTALV